MATEPSKTITISEAPTADGGMGVQAPQPAATVVSVVDGQLYVNGKPVTGSQVIAVERELKSFKLSDISWRSLEKLLAYGTGLVAATNGFAQLGLPTNLRETLLGVSTVIVAALHVTGPAATPNTSTS